MKNTLTILISIIITEALGFSVGMLTREGTRIYAETMVKPPLSPPVLLFPIAWTVLYALMSIGFGMILNSETSRLRTAGIILYAAQLFFNLAWCFIFFSFRNYLGALVWIIIMLVLVIGMTVVFKKVSPAAGYLQIPYIIWLLFATYLNAGVMVLNG
ncbi:MAG: tryptophan-rich sensory protein [Lachnospiraceae bacterium]|nr:tryptophan-rich sensory protein [Lachnospiraceae bacterium]